MLGISSRPCGVPRFSPSSFYFFIIFALTFLSLFLLKGKENKVIYFSLFFPFFYLVHYVPFLSFFFSFSFLLFFPPFLSSSFSFFFFSFLFFFFPLSLYGKDAGSFYVGEEQRLSLKWPCQSSSLHSSINYIMCFLNVSYPPRDSQASVWQCPLRDGQVGRQ